MNQAQAAEVNRQVGELAKRNIEAMLKKRVDKFIDDRLQERLEEVLALEEQAEAAKDCIKTAQQTSEILLARFKEVHEQQEDNKKLLTAIDGKLTELNAIFDTELEKYYAKFNDAMDHYSRTGLERFVKAVNESMRGSNERARKQYEAMAEKATGKVMDAMDRKMYEAADAISGRAESEMRKLESSVSGILQSLKEASRTVVGDVLEEARKKLEL